ncbi:MAG: large conductance mechanosensitive channel protein MscL [Eubacterium sp.]
MLKEFKEFAIKGNMIDLAVGVIIGGAFNSLVTSLVDNIIMPLISIVAGKLDFSNWFLALDGNHYATLAEAQKAGAATLNYGTFISGFINFLIMAFVVFLFVKGMNTLRRKSETPAEPTTKKCPYCQSEIAIEATRCPHCTSEIEPQV